MDPSVREGAWAEGRGYTLRPHNMMRYVQLQIRGGHWARGPRTALGLSGTREVAFSLRIQRSSGGGITVPQTEGITCAKAWKAGA